MYWFINTNQMHILCVWLVLINEYIKELKSDCQLAKISATLLRSVDYYCWVGSYAMICFKMLS